MSDNPAPDLSRRLLRCYAILRAWAEQTRPVPVVRRKGGARVHAGKCQ